MGFSNDQAITPIAGISYTKEQLAIIHWIVREKTIRETAEILDLSPRTVENYFHAVKSKASVKSKSKFIEIVMPYYFCENTK